MEVLAQIFTFDFSHVFFLFFESAFRLWLDFVTVFSFSVDCVCNDFHTRNRALEVKVFLLNPSFFVRLYFKSQCRMIQY